MGGGISSKSKKSPQLTEEETAALARFMHPIFTIGRIEISDDTLKLCQDSFDQIVAGNYHSYKEALVAGEDTPRDALTFLVVDFYKSLFIRLPDAKALFSVQVDAQAELLSRMIHTVITLVQQDQKRACESILTDMGNMHNSMGVHPAFYGEFGYTFICTLRKHFGESFSEEVNNAWVKLFSYILNVLIPIAVRGQSTLPS